MPGVQSGASKVQGTLSAGIGKFFTKKSAAAAEPKEAAADAEPAKEEEKKEEDKWSIIWEYIIYYVYKFKHLFYSELHFFSL